MKTKINLLGVTAIFIISLTLKAQVQESRSMAWAGKVNKDRTVNATDNKRGNLPGNLVENFNRYFPSAANVKWTTTNDGFFVNFKLAEKPVMASFNIKGEFSYSLTYGNESDLQATTLREIRKNYPSFIISKVLQIKLPGADIYQVILKNETKYVDLRVSADGTIVEAKDIKRADG